MVNFDLDADSRAKGFQQVCSRLEKFYSDTKALPVIPKVSPLELREQIASVDLQSGFGLSKAIDHVARGLEDYAVHTPHPKYFGLFNPRANFPSIVADLMTAAYNPQMAAWSHAPFAAEVEARLIREFATKFGYDAEDCHGTFTSGGTEANFTAVLCALNDHFADFANVGLVGIENRPIVYCSAEAHHSIHRSCRSAGLGYESIKSIETDESQRINVEKLERLINEDVASGFHPLMVVGTGGTTGSGAIDDLVGISTIAKKHGLWFHVDAAYGGGAILSRELRTCLAGIGESDSITFDAHKWMSVPMAASMFLTSHRNILAKTFRLTADYMPNDADDLGVEDPFANSMQWSRRFIGLKVYLSLLCFGWDGYEQVVEHQANMADALRQKLRESGWDLHNDSALPIVCFSHKDVLQQKASEVVLQRLYESGQSWVSLYPIKGVQTFRACITNYQTSENDLDEFVSELNQHRAALV